MKKKEDGDEEDSNHDNDHDDNNDEEPGKWRGGSREPRRRGRLARWTCTEPRSSRRRCKFICLYSDPQNSYLNENLDGD